MKTTILTLFLAFISVVYAVEPPSSISLERTTCFGSCPSYILTIQADGSVTFKGREYVKSKGTFARKIDAASLVPIFRKIEIINFWSLEDQYITKRNPDGSITMITDQPTCYVTVIAPSRTKKIKDYYGAPPELRELERMIDEVARVSDWINTKSE